MEVTGISFNIAEESRRLVDMAERIQARCTSLGNLGVAEALVRSLGMLASDVDQMITPDGLHREWSRNSVHVRDELQSLRAFQQRAEGSLKFVLKRLGSAPLGNSLTDDTCAKLAELQDDADRARQHASHIKSALEDNVEGETSISQACSVHDATPNQVAVSTVSTRLVASIEGQTRVPERERDKELLANPEAGRASRSRLTPEQVATGNRLGCKATASEPRKRKRLPTDADGEPGGILPRSNASRPPGISVRGVAVVFLFVMFSSVMLWHPAGSVVILLCTVILVAESSTESHHVS